MKTAKKRLGQTYNTLLSQGVKGSLAKFPVSFCLGIVKVSETVHKPSAPVKLFGERLSKTGRLERQTFFKLNNYKIKNIKKL